MRTNEEEEKTGNGEVAASFQVLLLYFTMLSQVHKLHSVEWEDDCKFRKGQMFLVHAEYTRSVAGILISSETIHTSI
jgi:hypothetical protein